MAGPKASRTRRAWLLATVFAVALNCLPAPARADSAGSTWALYQQRDFFALTESLPPSQPDEDPRIAFVRAATDAAFNRLDASSDALEALLRRPIADPSLALRARKLLLLDRRAQSRYASAIAAAVPAMSSARNDERTAELRNGVALLTAIADVPAQQVVRAAPPAPLAVDKDGLFAVKIDGHAATMGLDTGANFSFIPHKLAVAAGLRLRSSSFTVGTSTGHRLAADIASGDLTIGDATVRNVVFLVFPDETLTMPDGYVVPGMIGFPVFAALGGLRREPPSITFGPATVPAASNLALAGNDILTRIGFHGESLICRVDSGADSTTFYEPFYRRFKTSFHGAPSTAKLGGVGGAKTVPAYHPDEMAFTLAGRDVTAKNADVLTRPIFAPEDNYLFCNIGRDVLAQFGSYTIDLERLSLQLGDR